jgi:NADPH:quinone reductase-like Zn-dependent oxidoreductase
MKAVVVERYGDPDVLTLVDIPAPHAGQGEVRIRVYAAAVNPADRMFRAGDLDAKLTSDVPRPLRPGMDLAGVIDEVGDKARTDLQRGDHVMAMVNPIDKSGGAYAEYVVLPAEQVVRAPAGADHVHAATLPMNGLTARRAVDVLALPAGSWVAVTGAAGAVGGYAVQLARADGLHVIADAAPNDAELVGQLGAEVVVERGDDVAQRIRQALPQGVDAAIDAAVLGWQIEPAIRPGGQLAAVRRPGQPGVAPLSGRADLVVRDVWVPDYQFANDKLSQLSALAEQGRISLRVADVFDASRAADAHHKLDAGGVRGRLVLTF